MPFAMPAEWAHHERVWIGFPSHLNAWETAEALAGAQQQIASFANAIHDGGRGETVHLIAGSAEAAEIARGLVEPGVLVEQRLIGDVWLRDTGCIIVKDGSERVARNFGFNGWGGKYDYPGDQSIGRELAEAADLSITDCDWVLEGGSIDVDGEGNAVTTLDCLMNPNRNPGMTRAQVEARLMEDLGIHTLLWLGNGLANDHTDGHVDNLARFVAPGHLVIPQVADDSDPNAAVYADAIERARATGFDVTPLPSVGRFEQGGEAVPASYMNFYIGNSVVAMPAYGVPQDGEAMRALQLLFPERSVVALPADQVLTGGGSFHCSSQQVPSA